MSRPKGTKNKLGSQARENIVAVFNRLGGTAQMATWAKEHQSDFYRMYAQLVPKELSIDATIRSETDITDAELAAIATGSSEPVAESESGEGVTSQFH